MLDDSVLHRELGFQLSVLVLREMIIVGSTVADEALTLYRSVSRMLNGSSSWSAERSSVSVMLIE